MEDKDLKIRAAKVLGFKLIGNLYHPAKNMDMGVLANAQERYYPNQLQFTESYDWAMLGVKWLCEDGSQEQFEKYLDNWNSHMGDYLFAKPEQITRAWVEVLESASE